MGQFQQLKLEVYEKVYFQDRGSLTTATGVREGRDRNNRNISEGNNPSLTIQSATINNVQYTSKPNLVSKIIYCHVADHSLHFKTEPALISCVMRLQLVDGSCLWPTGW